MAHQQQLRSIFDVASQLDALGASTNAAAFRRMFRVTSNIARCNVGLELSQKYKVPQQNEQQVVSVTNLHTLEQCWYNKARTTKPQTFNNTSVATAAALDPTNNGAKCDFCSWQTLTAKDPGFGRIQLPHTVTGSNLFKYAEPSHGVVLFRHHDPLCFSQPALSDLLDASWLWFQASHKLHPTTGTHPFLLWNCLPRAGASQYHGHAQVMLSSVPVPAVEKFQRAASSYQQQHQGCCFYADLLRAHAAVGLLRQVTVVESPPPNSDSSTGPSSAATGSDSNGSQRSSQSQPTPISQPQQQQHTAYAFASVAPVKDMEIVVVGQHLCCPAFQRMLHAALRSFIDGLGAVTFNVGVLNVNLAAPAAAGVGLGRQFWQSSLSGDMQQHEGGGSSDSSSTCSDKGSSSNGQMFVSSSRDGHFTYTSNSASGSSNSLSGNGGNGSAAELWLPGDSMWASRPPVVARLVSRGKLGSAASDFGGLEVFGGASIGHTDPFTVVQQLDAQLAAVGVQLEEVEAAAIGRLVAN